MMNKFNIWRDKLQSLLKDKNTNWEYILGDFMRLFDGLNWNEKRNEWCHPMFSMLDIPIMILLAEEEHLEHIKKYMEKVSELGIQSWTKEMNV